MLLFLLLFSPPPTTARGVSGTVAEGSVIRSIYGHPDRFLEVQERQGGGEKYFMHIMLYTDREPREEHRRTYIENFLLMIKYSSPNIYYYVTVMGPLTERYVNQIILTLGITPQTLPNFFFDHVAVKQMGDICRHVEVMNSVLASGRRYNTYFFCNDGTKPVGINSDGAWINDFEALFTEKTVLAGPLISCQSQVPHVQTHFFAVKEKGLEILRATDCPAQSSKDDIYNREVLLSWRVMEMGLNIASLQPEYRNQIFTISPIADRNNIREYSRTGAAPAPCAGYCNPSICISGNPATIHFIKWGGTLEDIAVLPRCTFVEGGNSICQSSLAIGETGKEGAFCDHIFQL
mmetsp:Transcript_5314/g.9759  ORF Transcript_5314/g.9759 Transcript_5314/m.9759 type:complete len:348 (+) Transcript_5314:25-1068(+)